VSIVGPIRDFIATELVRDADVDVSEDRPLIRDGLINSIGVMKLISFLGDRFGVQFEDDDYSLENFETLRAIQRLVERRSPATTA
jgi:acyl carrier protein